MRYLIICLMVFHLVSHATATETLKADGYQGIWFELGQKSEYGDKYSGGLGTYTTSHVPLAIYSPKANKTFFVYGGTVPGKRHLLIMASYYDHATGTVPKPTIVHDKGGVNDPHDNAALTIDGEGRLCVFISGRGNTRPGFIYRAAKPYDIDSFELIHTREKMAYPQPWYVDGKGFLFLFTMYSKGREAYWMTSPDGRDWTEAKKLAGFGGHYQTSAQRGDEIISAFNYHPGGSVDKRTNLYFVRSNDFGKTWKNAAGEPLKTPLSEIKNPSLVFDYESEGRMVYIQDVTYDADGQPVILYVVSSGHQPGFQDPDRTWVTARWKAPEKSWELNPVTTSTHNYDVGAIYCEPDGLWRIIGPTAPGPQKWGTGGEMEMWTSANKGKSWNKEKALKTNSDYNHSYARRPVNAQKDFYALWADGHADHLSPSRLYFTTKDGQVFQLPTEMKTETAHPEKQ